MARLVFFNIGWMSWYKGLAYQADNIVGGGRYVQENKTGHEVCNFFPCADGYVYGHVETIQGETDRQIHIETWGEDGESLSNVDLIWTATHPQDRGRRVVGWYRDATIFRHRQEFKGPPSNQHRLDGIENYRASAFAKNTHLLGMDDRTLEMPHGKGWMGQTPWWSPSEDSEPPVREFVRRVRGLLDGAENVGLSLQKGDGLEGRNSPGTAIDPYIRYVQEHEIQVRPRHDHLQSKFVAYVNGLGAADVKPNIESVDLRYTDVDRGSTLVEVKPCDHTNARYAIRTAMGQLLDYRQRAEGKPSMLIVIEVKPDDEHTRLATSNGFGIGYPTEAGFEVVWPTQ